MKDGLILEVKDYVAEHIGEFHAAKISRLDKLKLKVILSSKNPYLYKAKHQESAHEIVKGILDSYISSSEESMFGDWLEGLAIFIAEKVYGGKKSSAHGIDLEFDKEGIHYLVSIKSGPHWGNSTQFKHLEEDFKSATKVLHTSKSKLHIEAVNGCCYGKDRHPDKGHYQKLCGQEFWEFISGRPNMYLEIIEPLSTKAKERNEEYLAQYNCKLNLFELEFMTEYAKSDGSVDWEKFVKMNSGKES